MQNQAESVIDHLVYSSNKRNKQKSEQHLGTASTLRFDMSIATISSTAISRRRSRHGIAALQVSRIVTHLNSMQRFYATRQMRTVTMDSHAQPKVF